MTITHVSYSSILLYLNNRAAWQAKYVLGHRDQTTKPAALTGLAFHKYMEMCLKGHPPDVAISAGLSLISSMPNMEWGSTGSPEKCEIDFRSCITHIGNEPYPLGTLLDVEGLMECKVRGIALPIKSFVDVIHEDINHNIYLVDWKTVHEYAKEPTPSQKLQACVYYWQTEKIYSRKPISMTFVQVKASKNKDGSPQVKPIVLVYAEQKEMMKAMKTLIRSVIKEMRSPRTQFLPNLRDDYEGEKELQRFIQNNMTPYAIRPSLVQDTAGTDQTSIASELLHG